MSDTDTDDRLVDRIAAGDREALTTLFRRRHVEIYRFALQMCGRPAIAEDVVQEVFLAVMRAPGRYQPGRSGVKAWLCGIARNHTLRHLDADRTAAALDEADGTAEHGMDNRDGVLGDLTRAERLEALRRAVLSLPVRYREVVVMCDLQELSYAEAAAALGCAVGTVRSRLHRGRGLLESKMAAGELRGHRAEARGARSLA